jgi:hypothetical protein
MEYALTFARSRDDVQRLLETNSANVEALAQAQRILMEAFTRFNERERAIRTYGYAKAVSRGDIHAWGTDRPTGRYESEFHGVRQARAASARVQTKDEAEDEDVMDSIECGDEDDEEDDEEMDE